MVSSSDLLSGEKWELIATNIDDVRRAVLDAYKRHAAELTRIANSLTQNPVTAQDAVQETFLRYFLSLSHGEKINNDRSWLHRVLRNLLRDWARSARSRGTVALDDVTGQLQGTPIDHTRNFRLQWLEKAAKALGARERECFTLRAQGLEYVEIAAEMKIRIGTVGALLNSAIRKLRQTLLISEGLS